MSREELIEHELDKLRLVLGPDHAERSMRAPRPNGTEGEVTGSTPSPRLGWLLLAVVLAVTGGLGWLLMLAADRATSAP